MGLSAVVIGTGWAGEGDAQALRAAGVRVVALCGRTPVPAQALGARLSIDDVRLDWRRALSELKPDIVAIATPGGPHCEMAVAAAEEGCHIFCEKPLGVTAADARAMLAAVRKANVKHAYGATSCLEPVISHVRSLLADGAVGTLTGIDVQTHMGLSRPLPFSWFHQLSQGGGMLNQIFTHVVAQVLRITDGRPQEVMGEARGLIAKAPVGPPIYDFRHSFAPMPEVNENEPASWRTVDVDTEYALMMRLSLPSADTVTASFRGSLTSHSPEGERLALYGSAGTLMIMGRGDGKEVHHRDVSSDSWHQLAVPDNDSSVASQSGEQRNWNAIVRRIVADIRGEEQSFYPSFADGCVTSEIIDIVRSGAGWTPVPASRY